MDSVWGTVNYLAARSTRNRLYVAPGDEAESAASLFHYDAAHRWWYFPGMHAGEALLIKLHDTDHPVAWRAPHTSFRDDAVGAAPRIGRAAHRRLLPLSWLTS